MRHRKYKKICEFNNFCVSKYGTKLLIIEKFWPKKGEKGKRKGREWKNVKEQTLEFTKRYEQR